MKLVLGTFARGGIEAISGDDLSDGVRRALIHFARRERHAPLKGLDRGQLDGLGSDGLDFELSVDSETEEALERRAREYAGITAEQLAGHAVLVYLADRDAKAVQPMASSR
jgi:hypothetical protein